MIGVLIFGASNATNVWFDLFASFVNGAAPDGACEDLNRLVLFQREVAPTGLAMIGVVMFGASSTTIVSIDLFGSFVNRAAPDGACEDFNRLVLF